MKVLSLGIGTQLFDTKGKVAMRIREHGKQVAELCIITYTGPSYKSVTIGNNVRVYPTNSSKRYRYFYDSLKLAWPIIKEWKKTTNEIVITSQEGMTNIPAIILSVFFCLGLEVQIHTDVLSRYFKQESLTNRLRLVGYWLGVKRARSVRVVSRRIARLLITRWRIDGKKISVLPVYLDKDYWLQPYTSRDNLHQRFPQFDKIILMASRFTREKNLPLALEAVSRVQSKFPRTGLVIVGGGSEQAGLVGGGVVVLPWALELRDYYHSADIFLLTSNYEGYGLTLVESALSGLPIVTTDVGVVGELITPHNALVAPVADVGKLADCLNFLVQNDEARRMMSKRLLQISKKLPDKDAYMNLFKASLERCIVKHDTPTS